MLAFWILFAVTFGLYKTRSTKPKPTKKEVHKKPASHSRSPKPIINSDSENQIKTLDDSERGLTQEASVTLDMLTHKQRKSHAVRNKHVFSDVRQAARLESQFSQ